MSSADKIQLKGEIDPPPNESFQRRAIRVKIDREVERILISIMTQTKQISRIDSAIPEAEPAESVDDFKSLTETRCELARTKFNLDESLMSMEHRRLIQTTWKSAIEGADLVDVGCQFFLKLFTKYPGLTRYFSFWGDAMTEEAIMESQIFIVHSSKVIFSVHKILCSLDDSDWFVPVLTYLGAKHVEYTNWRDINRILPFDAVMTVLRGMVSRQLGEEKYTKEVKEVWRALSDKVVAVMSNAFKGEIDKLNLAVEDTQEARLSDKMQTIKKKPRCKIM